MRCSVAISVLYVFSCSYPMENIISIVDLLARKTNVTLDKVSLQTLGKSSRLRDQRVFQWCWGVRCLDSCWHSPLSPLFLNTMTIFTSLMSCGTSLSIQHSQKISQNPMKASPLQHFRISAGIPSWLGAFPDASDLRGSFSSSLVGSLYSSSRTGGHRACVLSTLFYGSESWTLHARLECKLDVIYMRRLRRLLNIKRQDKVMTNNDFLERANLPGVFSLLKQRRIYWLSHVRMEDDRIPKEHLHVSGNSPHRQNTASLQRCLQERP